MSPNFCRFSFSILTLFNFRLYLCCLQLSSFFLPTVILCLSSLFPHVVCLFFLPSPATFSQLFISSAPFILPSSVLFFFLFLSSIFFCHDPLSFSCLPMQSLTSFFHVFFSTIIFCLSSLFPHVICVLFLYFLVLFLILSCLLFL